MCETTWNIASVMENFHFGRCGRTSVRKFITIKVYCMCYLPESYNDMVSVKIDCLMWFHYRCVGYKGKEKRWRCDSCKKICAPKRDIFIMLIIQSFF